MKEDLVIVLRTMFHYLVIDNSQPGEKANFRDYSDHILRLWQTLNTDAESRWAVSSLSLDSLRLEIAQTDEGGETKKPFVAHSFQFGWHFDSNQALAWAVLDLHAACIAEVKFSYRSQSMI